MFGSVVKLEAFGDALSLSSRERLVKGRHAVSVQVVEDDPDHWSIRVGDIHQPPHLVSEVLHGTLLGDGHVPPAG